MDPKQRTAWIAEKVDLAKAQFMDGINIDIEQAVESESPEYDALTKLVNETTEAFHREIPGSQVNSRPKVLHGRTHEAAFYSGCHFSNKGWSVNFI